MRGVVRRIPMAGVARGMAGEGGMAPRVGIGGGLRLGGLGGLPPLGPTSTMRWPVAGHTTARGSCFAPQCLHLPSDTCCHKFSHSPPRGHCKMPVVHRSCGSTMGLRPADPGSASTRESLGTISAEPPELRWVVSPAWRPIRGCPRIVNVGDPCHSPGRSLVNTGSGCTFRVLPTLPSPYDHHL
jgi:hypothetical protein